MPIAKKKRKQSTWQEPVNERADMIERLAEFLHTKTIQCCFMGKGSGWDTCNADQRNRYRLLAAGLMDDPIFGPAVRSVL